MMTTEMKRIMEIEGAIKFGKEAIEEYKNRNEAVPNFVYERIIELYEEFIALKSN